MQTRKHFSKRFLDNGPLAWRKVQTLKERNELGNAHIKQLGDVLVRNSDPESFLTQPASPAGRTNRPAAEAVEHKLVLNLVPLRLHPLEKFVNADI